MQIPSGWKFVIGFLSPFILNLWTKSDLMSVKRKVVFTECYWQDIKN